MKLATLFVSLGSLLVGISGGIASAATSYNITLHASAVVEGKELKPGDYKVVVDGNNATFRGEKDVIQTRVTQAQNDVKYRDTTVSYQVAGGKYNVEEIHIGGDSTKLVFDAPPSAGGN